MSFTIEAIKAIFEIKSQDNSLQLEDGVLTVSIYDKLKLLTNFRPNEKLRRLINVGTEKLSVKFDLMYQMKMMHHNQKTKPKDRYNHEVIDVDVEHHPEALHVLDMFRAHNEKQESLET
jgi:hypothetical protein